MTKRLIGTAIWISAWVAFYKWGLSPLILTLPPERSWAGTLASVAFVIVLILSAMLILVSDGREGENGKIKRV